MRVSKDFHLQQNALIEVIIPVFRDRTFEVMGYRSIQQYCIQELKLSPDQTSIYVGIVMKSETVPEFKTLVQEGKITLTNAKRLLPFVNKENKDIWLPKAQELSQAKLIQEIVKEKPEAIYYEKVTPVSANASEFRLCVDREFEELLTRGKEILSKSGKGRAIALEVLKDGLRRLIEEEDPIEKAKRAQARKEKQSSSKSLGLDRKDSTKVMGGRQVRTGIPAAVLHKLNLRDFGQCCHRDRYGKRCTCRTFLQIHHIIPVSEGGRHALDNLLTLCASHHKYAHYLREGKFPKKPSPPASVKGTLDSPSRRA